MLGHMNQASHHDLGVICPTNPHGQKCAAAHHRQMEGKHGSRGLQGLQGTVKAQKSNIRK